MAAAFNCVICDMDKSSLSQSKGEDGELFRCPVCGEYRTTGAWLDNWGKKRKKHADEMYLLSGYVQELNRLGQTPDIRTENFDEMLQQAKVHAPSSPLEAMDRILLYIEKLTPFAGGGVKIEDEDYPLFYCRNTKELRYLLRTLNNRGFTAGSNEGYVLAVSGWQEVAELKAKQPDSNQAFVAMWFDDELTPAWEDGIKPALEECGYNPLRVDMQEHNGKICDRIIADIRRSGLLVADFTGHRGGVYFEAGFAMGLGIPVIWTCRKTDIEEAHFDTRQYNHIVWETSEELRKKLVDRIQATCPLAEAGKTTREVADG
jgi:nucleoside 2-deoxyribosyltransferase